MNIVSEGGHVIFDQIGACIEGRDSFIIKKHHVGDGSLTAICQKLEDHGLLPVRMDITRIMDEQDMPDLHEYEVYVFEILDEIREESVYHRIVELAEQFCVIVLYPGIDLHPKLYNRCVVIEV